MKKIILLLIFLVLIGCSNFDDKKNEMPVLGYCLTMSVYAEQLEGFELVELKSSGEVLELLSKGDIDVALTGRRAYSFERVGFKEELLINGFTLIGTERKNVFCDELKGLEIASLEEVDYPYGNYTIFNYLEEAVLNSDAILIKWEDFKDYNLITPYCEGKKVLWFRSPHVYSKNIELIESIEQQNVRVIQH